MLEEISNAITATRQMGNTKMLIEGCKDKGMIVTNSQLGATELMKEGVDAAVVNTIATKLLGKKTPIAFDNMTVLQIIQSSLLAINELEVRLKNSEVQREWYKDKVQKILEMFKETP